MSTQKGTSLTTYFTVAAVAALIGFGAIYVMVGAGNNAGGPEKSNVASKTASAQGSTSASHASKVKRPRLNTGAMTTFVFKDAPMALPEVSFNDGTGKKRSLKEWRGKVVLLNLWATWCGPCRKEMPHLDQLKQELAGDNFDVVAVSVDRGSPEKSRKFLTEVKATTLKLFHDPAAQLGFTLKAIGMPTTLLINAKGEEIGRLVGPAEWHSEDAKRLIRAHLKP